MSLHESGVPGPDLAFVELYVSDVVDADDWPRTVIRP